MPARNRVHTAMAARTSSFRIDDLISSPKHVAQLCCDESSTNLASLAFAASAQLQMHKTSSTGPALGQQQPPAAPYLFNAMQQASALPQASTSASAPSELSVHRLAQLLALAQQSGDHRLPTTLESLDAIAGGLRTPASAAAAAAAAPLLFGTLPTACQTNCTSASQPTAAETLAQLGQSHMAHTLSPAAPPAILTADSAANQVTPIPWYIYQQMAIRQAFENGPCIPGISAGFHDTASYFFAAHQHSRKPKRIRTAFSPSQLLRLEAAFDKNPYVVGQERKELAASLNLSETQVKVWFQNRRTKKKRMKSDDSASQNGDSDTNENGVSSRPQSSLSFSSKDSRSCKSPTTSPTQS